MARPRRQAKARTSVLTWPQRCELMIGPHPLGSEFAGDGQRELAWRVHRETILARYPLHNAGSRPWAFWQFDGPPELRERGGGDEQIDGSWLNNIRLEDEQTARRLTWLVRVGQMAEAEIALVLARETPDSPLNPSNQAADVVRVALSLR